MKKLLSDLSIEDLKAQLDGSTNYRAEQIFKWVSEGAAIEQMTNVPAAMRDTLSQNYHATAATIVKKVSANDKSTKVIYQLNDGNAVEGIFIPHSYGNSLCVSTQVGCRMGCKFCASHIGGMVRNLTAGEIYGQVIESNRVFATSQMERAKSNLNLNSNSNSNQNSNSNSNPNANQNPSSAPQPQSKPISKIVLMGSGEPLDNFDNTTKFIRLVTHPKGLNLSQRSISLSTCGLPDKIRVLADQNYSVNLSLSLHATTDETRRTLMPIANKHTIKDTIDACRYYFDKSGRRVCIEYVLIKGVNMTAFDARRLKDLTKGMAVYVNLIMLNYVEGSGLKPCGDTQAHDFLKRLLDLGVRATLRKSAGSSAGGACGQLRAKHATDRN
ncbi:MAG: radical SAM protein [Firmicutes bacterium]|nr:radical SAM protein [Bacillota bacterium]